MPNYSFTNVNINTWNFYSDSLQFYLKWQQKKYPEGQKESSVQLPEKEHKQSKPYNALQCQPLVLLEEGWTGPIQSMMRGRKLEDTWSTPLRHTKLQMIQRLRCLGGLLIQDKYLTKNSVSVSVWFEGFPLNWINIPNRNSPWRQAGLKREVTSEVGRSWRFSQPDELNRLSEAITLYNTHTINLGIHKNCSAGENQSVLK